MPFNNEGKTLIKNLCQFKEYGSQNWMCYLRLRLSIVSNKLINHTCYFDKKHVIFLLPVC